ncbi:MAG: hypothetical protein ACRD0J_17870 [Acidimicrobiales bacterium]
MTGRFLTQPVKVQRPRRTWYRRRRYQVLMGLVAVGGAVFADRYDTYTPAQKGAELVSFYSQAQGDLARCNLGLSATLDSWHALGPSATSSQVKRTVLVAKTAEANCTPVNQDVYNLSMLQVPGPLRSLTSLQVGIYHLGSWADPGAATVLTDIETLARHPHDTTVTSNLRRAATTMAGDVASVESIFQAAAHQLGTRVKPLHLTPVSGS